MSLRCLQLLVTLSGLSLAQTHPIPLQRIQFVDSLVENRLSEFARVAKAHFINVSVERDTTDGGYIYLIYSIRYYEMVADFNSANWGKWTNQVLLFYGQADLKPICRLSNRTPLANLKRLASDLLPRIIVTLPDKKTQWLVGANEGEGPAIKFKIVNGREVYYQDKGGYRVRRSGQPPVWDTLRK